MEKQFLTYQKFIYKSQATDFVELLKANSIDFLLEDDSMNFDPSFANNKINAEYVIKIKKQDFEKLDAILTKISASPLDTVDVDYYLLNFTNEELINLLIKSDEWSKHDYLLAQEILKSRGQEINDELLATYKKQRIEELSKPEGHQKGTIIAGYILAFFGGLIGVFIGWHLYSHKKTLPNGDRVHGYSINDRKQGKIILILGSFFFLLSIILRIIKQIS